MNLFDEKYLTVTQQNDLFNNKKNYHLKYNKFNIVVKFLAILNLKKKTTVVTSDEDAEYKEIFDDLMNDLVNKLNHSIQLHKKVIEENKNQLK